jgi:epoxyqueuosine reductase
VPGLSSETVKADAMRLGFELVGICDAVPAPHLAEYRLWLSKGYGGTMDYLADQLPLKADPSALLPGVRSIVALGLNYNQPNLAREGEPRIARYALGRDYHKVLRAKLRSLARSIEAAHPGCQTRACVDSAPIFERDYAHLAGLGWFGKNTMLINSQRGSWFFLGLLLTTVEFEPDSPALGGCGSCRKCIEACPTGAIVFEEDHWQLDSRRCISYQTIEHAGPLEVDTHGWTFGCDICQEVCPFNQPRPSQPQRARLTSEADFLRVREWPSLERLAVIGEQEWGELTRGSPVRRTGLEGIRRNAQAACGPAARTG